MSRPQAPNTLLILQLPHFLEKETRKRCRWYGGKEEAEGLRSYESPKATLDKSFSPRLFSPLTESDCPVPLVLSA